MKKTPAIISYMLPRLRDILFGTVFATVVFLGPGLFNRDGDLGWHVAIGKYILEARTIPLTDIFSHTMNGVRFVPHEWLAEVAFALAYRLMGLSGDVLLTALLASITVVLVYEELVKRGSFRFVALFVTLWVSFVAAVHLLARPHMFTLLFVTIWTYWLEGVYKGAEKKIWRFPLLMLIWANTHGAFFAGFVVWGTYFADWLLSYWQGQNTKEMGKQLALIGGLSLAVTFINPSGIYLWGTTVGFVGNSYLTSNILEYLSPDFHNKGMWSFMFMVAFALFSLAQERKIQIREALLLAGWAALSLYSVRNMPLFAVITAPIFGALIQPWAEKLSVLGKWDANLKATEQSLRGWVWLALPALFFGYLLSTGAPIDEKGTGNIFLPEKMPVQAVEWLQANPQDGNLFNDYIWGSYVLFRMWPQQTVFIDARTDFYGERLIREYADVIHMNDGWENILDTYDVKWMLIPRDEALAKYLYSVDDDAWHVIYEDDLAVIFRRDG